MITFVYHPSDADAVQRAYRELYPGEQDRCRLRQSAAAEPGKLVVVDPEAGERRVGIKPCSRAVAWMCEASQVYASFPGIGETTE